MMLKLFRIPWRMQLKVRVVYAAAWMSFFLLFVRVDFSFRLKDFHRSETKVCGCMRCVMEPREDQWFSRLHDSRVPKFMNRTNSNLSELTSTWWMKLQPSKTGKLSEVVEPLFSLFHDEQYYNDSSPDRCRTCAVVGNSANLKGSHYGAIIDAHDFVFRMNHAPTKGYETDVGARTTHRAFYPESATDLDPSTHLVFLPFKVLDLQWLISAFTHKNITRTYRTVKPTIKANKDKILGGYLVASSLPILSTIGSVHSDILYMICISLRKAPSHSNEDHKVPAAS
ncbi:CMP-N-acetylneuraminate-beta-galactosamide-alpha-2,3-sialyltransferase 2-like isoform X2 [Clarias gariepinus]|uniref:CMP-N-acetylneuraminate-beta-galactosamide- alpha-2,3-sialyltransferase 2-like isoform X2 n=1 Tax=Clarias gariepinus TaxID=13013 RepID=UPI00234CA5C4|nr:CMP-N-acetylneuraminate-beta-galactosamide-alpha-2,3-sialyltransferase 2-like isoform X2 [Clarias gariepinus]